MYQQWQAAAVIQMGMGQQHEIDGGGIKAERLGIFLGQLASALVEATIDQNPAAGAFNEVAGTGDAAVGAVE